MSRSLPDCGHEHSAPVRAEVTRPCQATVLLGDLNTQKILPDNQSNSYIGFHVKHEHAPCGQR